MDKGKIIRDITVLLTSMGDKSNDMIEMQIKMNEVYQYIFDVWEDGYKEAEKSAWVKNFN